VAADHTPLVEDPPLDRGLGALELAKHVVDRSGVDQVLGPVAGELLQGPAKPHDRHGVIIARMTTADIETPHGLARAHLDLADDPTGALVLGHGAGAGVNAPDLVAAAGAAREQGFSVALVEQPYRVAGRRSPAPARRLDAAWTTVIDHLRAHDLEGLPLVAGGRSLGARIACRTAEGADAAAVLCLAFPLLPPRRSGGEVQSRLPELDAVGVPVLVVQGERDRFGIPPEGPRRTVVRVPGDHGLRADPQAVAAAVEAWLPSVVKAKTPT